MQHINIALIKRYLAGECTKEEQQQVEDWLRKDENLLADESLNIVHNAYLEKQLWQQLQDRIPALQHTSKRRSKTIWLSIAAAACLAGCILYSNVILQSNKSRTSGLAALKTLKTYTAQQGERLRIVLPDSSILHLMGGSSVQFVENFTGPEREVSLLQGELLLDVKQDVEKPFVVHSSGTKIKVLGTRFNVRNTKEDPYLSVVLATGSIQFNAAQQVSRVLKPGDELIYDKTQGTIRDIRHLPDTKVATDWTAGILHFDHAPLHEVFRRLENYYGVAFVTKGTVNQHTPLTATMDNLTLQQVLSLIKFSTSLQFSVTGSTVEVRMPVK